MDIRNIQNVIKRAARIKGAWNYNEIWSKQSLFYMYNSVKYMFDCYEIYGGDRKKKKFKRQSWWVIC